MSRDDVYWVLIGVVAVVSFALNLWYQWPLIEDALERLPFG